jgi:hypothetical protein
VARTITSARAPSQQRRNSPGAQIVLARVASAHDTVFANTVSCVDNAGARLTPPRINDLRRGGALARRLSSLKTETPGEALDSTGGAAVFVAAQPGFELEVGGII